jgi:glycerate 2-kinase
MHKLLREAIDGSIRSFVRYPLLHQELSRQDSSALLHILAIGKAAWQMAYVARQALAQRKVASCTILTKYGFYPAPTSKAAECRLHSRIRHVSCRERRDADLRGFDTSRVETERSSVKESDVVAYADETSAILAGDVCNPHCTILEAGHPVPDSNSIQSTRAILEHLQKIPEHEELIILLSGGSSALFELPTADHNLQDIIGLNRLLLSGGLDIRQMNQKRKELSQVKGGKALSHISCRIPAVYLLSDVEGNDPAIIGSGPFFATEDSLESSPFSILNSQLSIKPSHLIIGDNSRYLKVLRRHLKRSCELSLHHSSRFINLDIKAFAKALGIFAHRAKPGIYLFGGELTMKIRGNGKGGRCTHLALLMAKAISGLHGTFFFAYATDGNDNIPESAGAIVDGNSWQQMIDQGLDPEAAIRNCDSYPALKAIDAIIPARYTGTNVNEVYGLLRNEMGACGTR